jgi:hypothetical protein
MRTVSFYEQYVREYRTVLHLLEQTLTNGSDDPACDALARLHLLREDVIASFIHITERMQTQVQQGQMQVDVVLAAMVRECGDKMAALNERCAVADELQDDPARRRQAIVQPADKLFQQACQRMLKGSV